MCAAAWHRHQAYERPWHGVDPPRSRLSIQLVRPRPDSPPCPPIEQCAMLRSAPRRAFPSMRPPGRLSSSALGTLRPHYSPLTRTTPPWLILSAERPFSSAPYSSNPALGQSSPRSQPCPQRPRHSWSVSQHSVLLRAGPVRLCPNYTPLAPGYVRSFHSTPRNQISPLPFIAGLLKVSIRVSTTPSRVVVANPAPMQRIDLLLASLAIRPLRPSSLPAWPRASG